MADASLPAHHTKHLSTLQYHIGGITFHLCQRDDGISNGTALWLGGQILSAYLSSDLNRRPRVHTQQTRPRAVELGSGIGLTACVSLIPTTCHARLLNFPLSDEIHVVAFTSRVPAYRYPAIDLLSATFVRVINRGNSLVLCSLGYDVLATDTAHVCDSVLRRNIAANLQQLPSTAGSIQVRELDWNIDSNRWTWNDSMRITPNSEGNSSASPHGSGANEGDLLVSRFDLIVSSDTLYDVSLVEPFFRTVRAIAAAGSPNYVASFSNPPKPPVVLLALERRDPRLIERALASAPVPLTQVPTKKVRKAIEKAGIRWDTEDWEGVEIWKGTLESC